MKRCLRENEPSPQEPKRWLRENEPSPQEPKRWLRENEPSPHEPTQSLRENEPRLGLAGRSIVVDGCHLGPAGADLTHVPWLADGGRLCALKAPDQHRGLPTDSPWQLQRFQTPPTGADRWECLGDTFFYWPYVTYQSDDCLSSTGLSEAMDEG